MFVIFYYMVSIKPTIYSMDSPMDHENNNAYSTSFLHLINLLYIYD